MAKERLRKVTSPAQRVTDEAVIARFQRKGVDVDYVEFEQDYSVQRPNIKIYKDRKTGRRTAVVQQHNRVLPDGRRIDLAWRRIGNGRWQSGANAYSASVSGTKVLVSVPGQGETEWNPTLTLDGKTITCKPAVLTATTMGFADRVLEWDYGACRRRLVNTTRGLKEFWYFDADPHGEVVIDPRSRGDLVPDDYFCHDADGHPVEGFSVDKAGVKTVTFPEGMAYPCMVDDSFSISGSSSMVKDSLRPDSVLTFSVARAESTATVRDTVVRAEQTSWNDGGTIKYYFYRGYLGFDTSGLPESITVNDADLELYALSAASRDENSLRLHFWSGMPTYPHVPVVYGDYGISNYASGVGYVDITGIPASGDRYKGTFLGWFTAVLTEAGIASINTSGMTKWVMLTPWDHANSEPSFDSGTTNAWFLKTSSPEEPDYGVKLTLDYVPQAIPTVVTNDETDPAATHATINGEVTDTGGLAIDERGFDRWDYSAGEAVELWTESDADFGLGAFSHLWESLEAETLYSVRAKAHNEAGWGYGEWNDFYTGGTVPTVSTQAASAIEQYSAILNGSIDNLGLDDSCSERGFDWRKDGEETWHSWTESGEYGTGAFQHTPSLEPNTTYEFRAKAKNAIGWGYGDTLEFTTLPPPPFPPSVTTQAATAITHNSATGHGTIVDTGGETITCSARGFEWGTESGVYGNTVSSSGTFGTGSFSGSLTGLPSGTTIYYRAFATNAGGTGYGEEQTFLTHTLKSVSATGWELALSSADVGTQGVTEKLVQRLERDNWLTGWSRRKKFTLTGSTDGALTDYQVKLTVYKGSGSDSGSSVYLGGNCEDDFADLRFTSSDGETLLSYWIESYTSGTSAVVWVKLPSLPASPDTTDFYIYYDNSGASSAASGADTFIIFNDGSSLTGWTAVSDVSSGDDVTWSIDSGRIKATANGSPSNGYLYCDTPTGLDRYFIECLVQAHTGLTASNDQQCLRFDTSQSTADRGKARWLDSSSYDKFNIKTGVPANLFSDADPAYDASAEHLYRFVKNDDDWEFLVDGASKVSVADQDFDARYVGVGAYIAGDGNWVKFREFKVGKVTTNEPSSYSWDSEETDPGPWRMGWSSDPDVAKQGVTLQHVAAGNWGIDWTSVTEDINISSVTEGWWGEFRDSSSNVLCVPKEVGLELELLTNEPHRLTITLPAEGRCVTNAAKSNEFWLRRKGTLIDKFVILEREDSRSMGGTWVKCRCLQIMDLLADELVNGTYSASADDVTTILTALLAYQESSSVTLSGVDAALDKTRTLDIKWMSVLEAIQKVRDTVGGYLYVDTNRQLHLVESLGTDTGQQVRYKKNLKGIRKSADYSTLCNKLYILGHGEGASQIDLEDLTVTAEEASASTDATYAYLTLGGSYSAYKDFTGDGDALPGHITVWQYPEVLDVTSDWAQNTDQKLKALLADYNSEKAYKVNYTHAAYLKNASSVASYGTVTRVAGNKEIENATALADWGRVIMDRVSSPPTVYEVDLVNLEEKLAFERLALGNTIKVIDEDLDIDVDVIVTRMYWSDYRRLEALQIGLANRAKELSDWFQGLQDTAHAFKYYEQT